MKNKEISLFYFTINIVIAFLVFFWSLDLITYSFKLISSDVVEQILSVTSNPFIGLFIGIFITSVIQSSSTSTSLIVAIVASGSLTLDNAIPMIMGANIGTTITSTIVSLSFIANSEEFKKAFAAGIAHDFFNILTVSILLPIEYYYHFLSKFSSYLTEMIGYRSIVSTNSINEKEGIFWTINDYLFAVLQYEIIVIAFAFVCLLVAVKLLANLISKKVMVTKTDKIEKVFFKNNLSSFGLGAIFTTLAQSSSISTSIIVPISVTSNLGLKKIFPYLIGANIGTTITALIASFNKSESAISIALVHLLFNAFGMLLFLFVPFIKSLPVYYAIKFSALTKKYKLIGPLYILMVFFLLPLCLIYFFN